MALASLPTPVERAAWLDTASSEVWVKRDDRTSALYGGSKVRKLEWILANAPYDGDVPIASVGGIGSHHLVALALHLQPLGRELHALTFMQVPTAHVIANLAAIVSSGAKLWPVATRARLPWAFAQYRLLRRPARRGRWLAAGASTPLGCFGYVEAGLELASQIDAGDLPRPDAIYVTAGSAGTGAGLLLGLALAGAPAHVHLVSSVERWGFNAAMLRRKIRQTHRALARCGLHEAESASAASLLAAAGITWTIDHDEVGDGYGVPTDAARAARELAAAHGLALETTYTAKCLAALRRVEGRGADRRRVLFWNTHAGTDLADHIDPDWRLRCPFEVPPAVP
jgi:D-cysteine desulfhydrase